MDEKDVLFVRRIVKETVHEVLEIEFYDALFEMLGAFEVGIQSFKQQLGAKKGVAAVKEETFTCLNFEVAKGDRIGEFEVASREKNSEAQWLHAYNILRQNNATINNRFQGEGYQNSYWLYGEGKIYRQKLKPKQT